MAATAQLSRVRVRALLAVLCLAGPVVRSYARDFRLRLSPLKISDGRLRLQWSGSIPLEPAGDVAELTEALRSALLERGATVALTDGYQPYDLQIRARAGVTTAINLLDGGDGQTMIGWKLAIRPAATLCYVTMFLLIILILLGFEHASFSRIVPLFGGLFGLGAGLMFEARRIPPLLELAAKDIAERRTAAPPATANAAL